MKVLSALSLILLTAACGTNQGVSKVNVPLQLHREVTPFFTQSAESTPIVFHSQLLLITFRRDSLTEIQVRDYAGNILHTHAWDRSFGCAFVLNDTIYVYSTLGQGSTEVQMISTKDLETWSDPIIVLSANLPNQTFYNTSVTQTDTGYVMAVEVTEPGTAFTFRFATSTDLIHWTFVGERFDYAYSACPTVRFINGVYYILFLKSVGDQFQTYLAETTDLIHFQTAVTPILAPIIDEGINASDADLVEFQGVTYITYNDGDQSTWGDAKWATFDGSIETLFESYF